MNVEEVKFNALSAEDRALTDMIMRVDIIGQDIVEMNTPLVVDVGAQPLLHITPLPNDTGISGLLAAAPGDGDAVHIGYLDAAELVDTGFEFEALVG